MSKTLNILNNAVNIYNKKGMCQEVKLAEKKIIESKNPVLCLWFYCYIKESDCEALGKVIYESKKQNLITTFENVALTRQKDLVKI